MESKARLHVFRELRLVLFSLLDCLLAMARRVAFFCFLGCCFILTPRGFRRGWVGVRQRETIKRNKLKPEESNDISWRVHVELVSMYPYSYQQEHYCFSVRGGFVARLFVVVRS